MTSWSDLIETEERRAQREFASSEKLPVRVDRGTREQLESMGIVFGEEDQEGIFVVATLPEGWKRQATDNSFWTNVVDEHGSPRLSVFVKSSFLSTQAFVRPCGRFYATIMPVDGFGKRPRCMEWMGAVIDTWGGKDTIVFRTTETTIEPEPDMIGSTAFHQHSDTKDSLEREAQEWLAERFPDHANRTAYWDHQHLYAVRVGEGLWVHRSFQLTNDALPDLTRTFSEAWLTPHEQWAEQLVRRVRTCTANVTVETIPEPVEKRP